MKKLYFFSSILFLFFSTLFSCKLDPEEQEIIKVGGNLSFNGGEILEHNLFQTSNERSATTNGTPIGDITPTYIITAYQGTKIGPSIKTTEQTWELGIQEGYWFFLCQGYQSTSIFDESTLIQICGRVGRKSQSPTGKILFLGNKLSKSMDNTILSIYEKNGSFS